MILYKNPDLSAIKFGGWIDTNNYKHAKILKSKRVWSRTIITYQDLQELYLKKLDFSNWRSRS